MSQNLPGPRRSRVLTSLRSILVDMDRTDGDRDVLLKAMVLARHFGAELTLFLCDAEHAFWLRHAYSPDGIVEARERRLEDARDYLESFRKSVHDETVRISIAAAVESPLHEGIVRKLLNGDYDLALKMPGGRVVDGLRTLDEADRQLVRTCPVPLMLTRGRAWRPVPRVASVVDVSRAETPQLDRVVAQAANSMAVGCGGQVHFIFAECADDAQACICHAEHLHELARDAQSPADCIHILKGDARTEIPRLARDSVFDIVVLGALGHRKGPASEVGSLTGDLLDSCGSDFLVVKSPTHVSPVTRQELQLQSAPRVDLLAD